MNHLCSWNASDFPDQNWYRYANGSVIYCDDRYPLNFGCNATIGADPDIAGPGVIVGFVATAWCTVIVAGIAATCDTLKWWDKRAGQPSTPNQSVAPGQTAGSSPAQRPVISPVNSGRAAKRTLDRLERFTKKLLNSLCDLQLVTGMAIVIAGLVQMPEISYYHEQFVINYWNLTLSSFWAARGGYTADDYHSGDSNGKASAKSLRVLIRMATIVFSCVLSVIFQGLALAREGRHWDFLQRDRCYLLGDTSGAGQARFWIVGVSVYAFVVLLCFIPTVENRIKRASGQQRDVYDDSKRWKKERWKKERWDSFGSALVKVKLEIIIELIIWVLFALLRIFLWLLIQFMSIWSYGKGFYAFEVLFYIAVTGWNMGDIISLKVMNEHLLEGSEKKWGFGQVLPTALLGVVIFNTIDAFRGEIEPNLGMVVADQSTLAETRNKSLEVSRTLRKQSTTCQPTSEDQIYSVELVPWQGRVYSSPSALSRSNIGPTYIE
ncbi:MAG: hypothetical protein M1839_003084 [Geoglossum umbratile]|nr:MAG: hypothetical protein M1839_003084 [Geoglossum umbratile]